MPAQTPPKQNPSPAPDIYRTLANALFAAGFMDWERITGPVDAPPGSEVDAIQGRTDGELVDMIDGGVFDLEGKQHGFDTIDAKDWIVVVTKYKHPITGNTRFDGTATNARTLTMVHLANPHAAHVYGIGADSLDEDAASPAVSSDA